eukprot:1869997-Rhodomonas_salina.1
MASPTQAGGRAESSRRRPPGPGGSQSEFKVQLDKLGRTLQAGLGALLRLVSLSLIRTSTVLPATTTVLPT